ncbi:hypothetical protein EN850_14250 [Mesorhizobium sp. M8A.F.Ca.ET.207.01.1.1]|uniref:AAA family ATPase n=1 Tax=Mesorhizobium sp. M8A.F.Ca.ET.207.01.1.1 TaxID=2563968 RepID=UPI00109D440A|nr:AAA family ATPase [Mesorhizobium sp. M8A.F.Ca.ET.207.01.1.1]TGQ80419.1 hypothetical protein EN850_14250 [Mesorhizobium sp. M8A.F.Ca.ET.207.01.1.1]
MKIVQFRVKGFQSFDDSGDIFLANGMNIIIGQNNAGKSALLRALLVELPNDRHRTPEKWKEFRLPEPETSIVVEASGPEIGEWALRLGGQHYIPQTKLPDQRLSPTMEDFFDRSRILISVNRGPSAGFRAQYPSHNLFIREKEGQSFSGIFQADNGDLKINIGSNSSSSDSLPTLLFSAWQSEMFYFAAERMTIGESAYGHSARLRPNAGNLPNVLHTLSGERGDVFRQLINHLREIFQTVGNLSVRTRPDNNNLEVRVWPTEAMEQVELSFPLNSSGTGVSQVIALLTAIMTIDRAVIIIDEINSFLHPAAVKALLRILQTRYANHQYIISTHAPEVIGFSNPNTIHLVKRIGYDSSVERLSLDDVGKFREVAEHLGVSMADVFAAERVIWVEGPTEELCFPYLYQQLVGPIPRGTIITSVAATGDFNSNKRDPAIVYEVYNRLSSAAAMLVVSVLFSFDTEKLTEEEKAKMTRDSSGLLHFLPRRHLECYLIDPAGIAAFIISKDPASAETLTPEIVETKLREEAGERPFRIAEWKDDITDEVWLARVDAANLIARVCGNLSNHRASFTKKNDTLFVMKHMLEHRPDRLAQLRDYVENLVATVTRD